MLVKPRQSGGTGMAEDCRDGALGKKAVGREGKEVAKTGGSWSGWRWRRLRRAVKAGGGQDGGGARGGGGGLSGRQRRWSW